MYGNTPSNLWKLYTPQFREQKTRGPDEPITEAAIIPKVSQSSRRRSGAKKMKSVFCGGVYAAKTLCAQKEALHKKVASFGFCNQPE